MPSKDPVISLLESDAKPKIRKPRPSRQKNTGSMNSRRNIHLPTPPLTDLKKQPGINSQFSPMRYSHTKLPLFTGPLKEACLGLACCGINRVKQLDTGIVLATLMRNNF